MTLDKKLLHILQKIKDKESFHEQLPNVGKIVFNKLVPYFFLYRISNAGKDKTLSDLAKSQLSYIIVQYDDVMIEQWIIAIAKALKEEFGSCLIIEVWSENEPHAEDIRLQICQKAALPLAEYFERNMEMEAQDLFTEIIKQKEVPHAPDYAPLYTLKKLQESNIYLFGLAIQDNYHNEEGKILPILQRHVRESLAKTLSRLFFEYVRRYTSVNPASFKLNINKEITANVFEIDQALSQENLKFDFLLLVTPVNAQEAWEKFKKSRFTQAPNFQYRPMPVDPDLVKRKLYNLPIEDIYDPTIAYLFRDKRRELEEMMSMLDDRNTEDFLHGSLQVFGNVSDQLLNIAQAILTVIEVNDTQQAKSKQILTAREFAHIAKEEINYLQQQAPEVTTSVRVRSDIAGIMVNRGILNISTTYQVPKERVQALIQHEVGTHVATYFNGKMQPLHLFSLGVPGYEQLQEGLAVLSEYLVGGLTNDRLRILAARVVAVRHMLMGYKFIDTFHLLVEKYHFAHEESFTICMRIYRGGGLTKDAVYLQGLIELIEYIRSGEDIALLTIGKIRKDYLPIIQDLIQRGYMKPPIIKPRYLSEEFQPRLESIRSEGSIFKLIK